MEVFLTVLAATAYVLITALQILMFVSVILSWIPSQRGGKLNEFVSMLVEPAIFPVRFIFEKFGYRDDFPIDIPFFCTFLIISILKAILFS